jgi:hypothetical protein
VLVESSDKKEGGGNAYTEVVVAREERVWMMVVWFELQ